MTTLPPFTRATLSTLGPRDMLGRASHDFIFHIGRDTYCVSPEELALLDPRLPLVANKLVSEIHKNMPQRAAHALVATLRYWETPVPIRINSAVSDDGLVLETIMAVHEDDRTRFSILYAGLELAHHADLTFVARRYVQPGWSEYAWCEQHFPGSVERLKTCFTLDMTSEEIAQFGFYTDMPAAIALPALPIPGFA